MSVRPFVLSANDGIVSIATLLVGIQGASTTIDTQRLTGIFASIAGALSMSIGEYISVSAALDAKSTDENPTQAATVSAAAFLAGASIPLAATWVAPDPAAVAMASLLALAIVGYVSHDQDKKVKGTLRVVSGGSLAFLVSYMIGRWSSR